MTAHHEDSESRDRFVELITQHRSALFGYILALVQNSADAEDLLQQTLLVVWRKFDQYDPQKSFVQWTTKVAQYEVLNFLRQQRRKRIVLSDELLGELAIAVCNDTPERQEALEGCLEKLDPEDRELIETCYCEQTTIKAVAIERGRSVEGVYKSVARIRRWLYECVERVLSQKGGRS